MRVRDFLQILQQNFHTAAGARKYHALQVVSQQILRQADTFLDGAFSQSESFVHHRRVVDEEMPFTAP